jgi:hypothetical protein
MPFTYRIVVRKKIQERKIKNKGPDPKVTPVFFAVFIVVKRWKQPIYPSKDELVSQMWCTYTTEYYSAFKRKEILALETT